MINWFDVPSESPNKDLTLKNLKVSENGTYGESGVAYSSVEVDVNGGGGGDSDFSTANVTISLSGSIVNTIVQIPCIIDEEDFTAMCYDMEVSRDNPTVVTCVLYKGKAILTANYPITATTGSVEVEGTDATVTGDCSITLSN